jgi:general secretion pathway protein A
MYDRFYGFTEEPFRLSPDHHFAYQHRGYKKARAYMAYAFMRAEGFVMVTGRPGTGKTTLVGALMEDLAAERACVANLVCSQLQADDLLKMVAYEFGVDINISDKGSLLQHLIRKLQQWHREGSRALLIVDEAQDLCVSAMEELRLLTNIQHQSRPLLQIFLLGQPGLRELVLRPEMEQVHQRIVAASHLQALECDETEGYIRHRLMAAGWKGDPAISSAVYPLVFKFSEGVPRRINLICSRLLLHGSMEGLHRIGVQDVRSVVGELQSESLAAGPGFTEHDFRVEDVFESELEAVEVGVTTPSPAPAVSAPRDSSAAVASAPVLAPVRDIQPAAKAEPVFFDDAPINRTASTTTNTTANAETDAKVDANAADNVGTEAQDDNPPRNDEAAKPPSEERGALWRRRMRRESWL